MPAPRCLVGLPRCWPRSRCWRRWCWRSVNCGPSCGCGRLQKLRERRLSAHEGDDARLARGVVGDLASLYASRPETAHGRKALADHAREVIDGSDLIALAERDLLAPLDARARTMVLESSKRVSIVTAVSPRALVDLAFVLVENMRLIRRLSQLYGGRPGTLGFWRLARNVHRSPCGDGRHRGRRRHRPATCRPRHCRPAFGTPWRRRRQWPADSANRHCRHRRVPACSVHQRTTSGRFRLPVANSPVSIRPAGPDTSDIDAAGRDTVTGRNMK